MRNELTKDELVLELQGVSRRFGQNIATNKVDLKVRKGTVHAVVGENGAGKSTLMKIAYGQIRADEGSIYIKAKEVSRTLHCPASAIEQGVGMVHQHFMLVPTLSVVENVILGREPSKYGVLQKRKAVEELRRISQEYGLEVNPEAIVSDLSVGEQQRVEIVKVLWQGCDILILDEPTAVLTPLEVKQLFDVLRSLVAQGMSIVMITHKLDEVVALADDITVMRRAKVMDVLQGKAASVESIAQAMVGRSVLLEVEKKESTPGEVVLAVENLKATNTLGVLALAGVSLTVRSGEIVGIAGVEGNGQSELQECVVGLRRPTEGSITIEQEDVLSLSIAQRYARGLAHIPEDRHARAIVLDFETRDNLILGRLGQFSNRFSINRVARDIHAKRCVEEHDIRPEDSRARASEMSGGNQQKIVIARELDRPNNKIIICAQPTRGVDISAVEMIHKKIIAARDAGLAVLLFSAELSELQSLSDRILVMYGGKISLALEGKELASDNARLKIGAAMTGAAGKDRIKGTQNV